MNHLELHIIIKILIGCAIVFWIIRHYFDGYCQRRFDYDFLNKTGVGFVLLFLAFNLIFHLMLQGFLNKETLAVMDGLVLLGSLMAIWIFNIQKTNFWIGTAGTVLQFTVLMSVVLFIVLIWLAWTLFVMMIPRHSNDDNY